jgi:hypothetical protein
MLPSLSDYPAHKGREKSGPEVDRCYLQTATSLICSHRFEVWLQ